MSGAADRERDLSLLDPSLLQDLTPEQRQEALAAAAAAKRAEERAEQRALERALAKKEAERKLQQQQNNGLKAAGTAAITSGASMIATTTTINPQIKFVSKRQRQKEKEEGASTSKISSIQPKQEEGNEKSSMVKKRPPVSAAGSNGANVNGTSALWTEKERHVVRQTYLGKSSEDPATALDNAAGASSQEQQKRQQQRSNGSKSKRGKKDTKGGPPGSKKAIFRFEWDNTDDTLDQSDPLYASTPSTSVLLKRGRGAGTMEDPLQEGTNNHKRHRGGGEGGGSHHPPSHHYSVQTKPLEQMTARDWRIFRENYEIVVKGGRAPPPLRNFREGNLLHPSLISAIENVLHYKEPTPIQRQAIPIGLQRRDLIGIAETGSGKTAAFGLPLLQYLMELSPKITSRVAEDGPLALVVAPTRELALQIHGEFLKLLSRQTKIRAAAVVGGQSIQHQAQELREGVHIVVGTPGRINDCIEMAYMVLNQCCYIVLDEADRMIDMGFAPQMESILDAMGGLLKSESEQEAYQQEEEDRKLQIAEGALPKHRLTAMFSATMPLEVERMAQRYLRHPAVISIGDQDSSKNNRITQRIIYLSSPSQKEKALRDLILNPRFLRDKVIVFVNEKRHADGVGRMIERFGRPCVVLHGGKSQDQREENLAEFRRGGGVVLVATDVAGRGLDIPNVAHVINYDLPSRSIDSYSHRIGRTGRAGNQGLATSLLTDEDQGIMAPLKQYLESTGQPVPDKLARHPAANANTAHGNLIY